MRLKEFIMAKTGYRPIYNPAGLIKLLKSFYKQYKKIPSLSMISKCKYMPSKDVFNRNFGSWKKALTAAGFDITKINTGNHFTKWQHETKYRRPRAVIEVFREFNPSLLSENLKKDYQFSDK